MSSTTPFTTTPATMPRRRFGRTELQMPVLSCGGMRYQYKWQDVAPEDVPAENQANLEATIRRAVELGINHIETARGYGSSEMQLGWILPGFSREELIVQTKVAPHATPEGFRATFEKSMAYLKLDSVDLLAFHGVNNAELVQQVIRPGGCLEEARKIQAEGRAKHIGFSTHAPLADILTMIETGEFDYINLHWYFVGERNWPAIQAATRHDMGVFIISPTDKGGRLYDPPAKLVELCRPLSPIAFNDLFCLSHPEVHTLSIGAARPSDFDEHVAALADYDRAAEVIGPIEARLRGVLSDTLGADWVARWETGLPEFHDVAGEVNLLEILRLYNWARALDMTAFGKSRYNMLGSGGHWQPGRNILAVDDLERDLAPALKDSPFAARIPDLLREAHDLLGGDAVKRLSQS